jgi:uncharacterized repeat protein (TIGR03803 family)
MKIRIQNLFLVLACTGLLAMPAAAQTFTNLHNFENLEPSGSDPVGAVPNGDLILSGNTLYGTTRQGGTNADGIVFAVNTDGSSFTNLYSFAEVFDFNTEQNAGGANPEAGLILSGNTLYGTAGIGGEWGSGTVFAINTNSADFTDLYSFAYGVVYSFTYGESNNVDGARPGGSLVLSGNTLYGTAADGGTNGYGTVFAINTNGTNDTTLYSFTNGGDGANPEARLILSGNTLYGTAYSGGSSGYGTVFAINTNGMGFTTLYSFTNGSDGANPKAGLILSGNTLYGTAYSGGTNGYGTVFAINTNGMGFTNLYSFTGGSDGANPEAGLILSGNTLYGTAYSGGNSGSGTVFAVETNGTGFTNLHNFTALSASYDGTNSDGANPVGGLILSGNTLYGTASQGGVNGYGTVFALSLPAQGQNLFETDQSGNHIYEFTNNAGTLSSSEALFVPFSNPIGLAFDSASNLFVGSGAGNYINEITPGGVQTYFAYAFDPQGMAFDSKGNLFVSLGYGDSISIIEFTNNAGTLSSSAVTFVSGLSGPAGLAFDRAGDLFEADSQSGHVYEFTNNAGMLSSNYVTIASNLTDPCGLAFNSAGDLFVGDSGTGNIYQFTNNAGTLSSNAVIFATGLSYPVGMVFDSAGNLFVANGAANTILEFTNNAGTLSSNYAIFASGLSGPSYLAFAPNPTILTNIVVSPASQIIATGSNVQFTATGYFNNGSTQALTGNLTWSSSNPSVATINTKGVATGLTSGTTTITATDDSVSNNTTLTVKLPITGQTNKYLFTGSETNITLPPGTYTITAYGAQGGSGNGSGVGGQGAEMEGEFSFSGLTTLTLLVGEAGGNGIGSETGGGGGGSFVVNSSTPLVIAGGGGGGGYLSGGGGDGLTGTSGGGGYSGGGGGTSGSGGSGGPASMFGAGGGGGGGGFYAGGGTGGTGASHDAGGGGASFEAGGGGASFEAGGGYGGGGGSSYGSGGGGGGYSGGGGGGNFEAGGGGGSIIDSTAIMDLAEISGVASPDSSTNGEIIITAVPPPAPSLSIALTNGSSVVISWPSPSTGFVLQQNSNLATTNWTTTGYSINTANGTNSITITQPTGNLFFRLMQ